MQNHIVKNYNLKAEIRIAPSLLRISALRFMGYVDKIDTDEKRGQKVAHSTNVKCATWKRQLAAGAADRT